MTCHVICKQWVSLLPFPVLTHFLFLVWLLWLGLKILCWIKIVLMSISVFFVILKEMLELFTNDVGFYDVRCGFVHAWPLLCWGLFSLLRWEFFLIINGCCIFSKNFSMSIKKIVWIFFFLFIAAFAAYGSSQSRGQVRAAAVAYTTVMATLDLSHSCDLHHS